MPKLEYLKTKLMAEINARYGDGYVTVDNLILSELPGLINETKPRCNSDNDNYYWRYRQHDFFHLNSISIIGYVYGDGKNKYKLWNELKKAGFPIETCNEHKQRWMDLKKLEEVMNAM